MTHTAEPMTLAQLSADTVGTRRLRKWKAAIDAELAKQREGEPVGWQYRLSNEEGVSAWYECRKQDVEILQSKEGYEVRPVYTHPQQRDAAEVSDNELPGMWSSTDVTGGDPDERCYAERNAVEVTDEMVRIAQKAYKNAFGKSQAGALRAALNAVLSAVASRNREDKL